MASSTLHLLLFLIIILTPTLSLCTNPIFLPLTHSLSKTQFTSPHHLLKSTTTNSLHRFQNRHKKTQKQISLPLSSGSDYTLSLSIGVNPTQTLSLYMDTGSDLIWFPCKPFNCILCENKFVPAKTTVEFNASFAKHVPCKSSACSAAHSSVSTSDLCSIAKCPLDEIETSDCSSFHCPQVKLPSPLILGKYENKEETQNFIYTPMLENPKFPYFYSVGLTGISVGGKKITAPDILKRVDREGNGGMVVDSGTTFTMLPPEIYDSVVTEFERRVGRVYKRDTETEDSTGLSPCWMIGDSVGEGAGRIPVVALQFVGNVSVVLPTRNIFYEFEASGGDGGNKRKVGCLMLMNGGDDAMSGGPAATLGNYQQQGFEVVYDLEWRRVGFGRRKCASLWDNLNQR
ncbi:Xylanase inhibitor, N-terminal [Dillenia turbinata]|uniref:Xylanase inhibitor, N-terminal n=1 Tax=Dillenia turbinata TaxID=194707 RepID=A0AAN8WFT9_9MAGN